MPKRYPEQFAIDVLICFDTIYRFMAPIKSAYQFVSDEATFIVVTRELEIIGEAVGNILKDDRLKPLVKPEWRDIVDFRNVIVHEYFGMNYEEIFDIVTAELPMFDQEFSAFIDQIKDSESFRLALAEAKNDVQKIGRLQSLDYLKKLELSLYR